MAIEWCNQFKHILDATQGWIPTSGIDEVTDETPVPYSIDFLVIAGGGAGGS
jgi:hypothetical protein